MLQLLSEADIDWDRVALFQVDERVAPAGDLARNLTELQLCLFDHLETLPRLHAMPVEADDLAAAAARYAAELPERLDLIHLGLGADGHTASLVPGDPVLGATTDVAMTASYMGHRRMTLTYPVLDRARRVVWLVTGAAKRDALAQLVAGDASIPAARVARERAIVVCDREASAQP
jgi:6-phosphogluconolactonase